MTPLPVVAVAARWQSVRYGFLFVPGLVAAGGMLLAVGLVMLDRAGGADGLPAFFAGDAAAARAALSTIATALITVAGLSFSITIVSLQLLSQQFSPRALRGFLADRLTQFIAGWFLGVFAYSLVVLRSLRSEGGSDPFVPSLSITVAMALAVVGVGLLLVFIHHMSNSIQLSTVAARIGRGALEALDTLYPDPFGTPGEDGRERDDLLERWYGAGQPEFLYPDRPGHVTSVMLDRAPEKVGGRGLRVHVLVAPGDFAAPSRAYAAVWPGEGGQGIQAALAAAVAVGNERDLEQDLGYTLRQLADIAIRALSPGVNDPTTAVTAIRYAEEILTRLATRGLPSPIRRYPANDATVVVTRRSFGEYVDVGVTQVGRHAVDDVRVVCELLEAIGRIARAAARARAGERSALLLRTGRALGGAAADRAATSSDRAEIRNAIDEMARPDGPAGTPFGDRPGRALGAAGARVGTDGPTPEDHHGPIDHP